MSVAVSVNEDARATRSPSVIIVGAGFGGVAAAIELKRAGIDDVRILERAADLRRSGESFVLASVVRALKPASARPGDRALIVAAPCSSGTISPSVSWL